MLDLLTNNPRLRDLQLARVRWGSPASIPTDRRVDLLYLRRLAFSNLPPTAIIIILSYLHLPSSVAATINGTYNEALFNYDDLIQGMSIHLDLTGSVELVAAGSASACRITNADPARVLSQIPLSSLRTLWICGAYPYNLSVSSRAALLSTLARGAIALSHLVLQADASRWLSLFLSVNAPGVLFPRLETLDMHQLHSEEWWNVLASFLVTRKAAGHTVHTVRVYEAKRQLPEMQEQLDRPLAFEELQARAGEVKPYVDQVEFIRVQEYPKMPLPAVCADSHRGRWDWPSWMDVGEVVSDT